ncbi:MAG: DUF4399 domain-containing protein [Deltaproteobacteria bacterium]|jgi:hypothetical protein|nr:DUF4399 domain-containing protein [Deltaproteobacteria bacterium]
MKNEVKVQSLSYGLAGLVAVTACGSEDPPPVITPEPIEVGFVYPANGQLVPTEFLMQMFAKGVELAPIDRLQEGQAYFVLSLDGTKVPAGEVVPFAWPYLHLVGGDTLLWMALFPGDYRVGLMLVGKDGRALDVYQPLIFSVR